jgi:hypothetical protein
MTPIGQPEFVLRDDAQMTILHLAGGGQIDEITGYADDVQAALTEARQQGEDWVWLEKWDPASKAVYGQRQKTQLVVRASHVSAVEGRRRPPE